MTDNILLHEPVSVADLWPENEASCTEDHDGLAHPSLYAWLVQHPEALQPFGWRLLEVPHQKLLFGCHVPYDIPAVSPTGQGGIVILPSARHEFDLLTRVTASSSRPVLYICDATEAVPSADRELVEYLQSLGEFGLQQPFVTMLSISVAKVGDSYSVTLAPYEDTELDNEDFSAFD